MKKASKPVKKVQEERVKKVEDKRVKHVIKLRHPVVKIEAAAPLPEPVRELVEAIHDSEVEEIVLVDPEPERLAKLKEWLESADTVKCPKCGSVASIPMGEGKRCNQCGTSF